MKKSFSLTLLFATFFALLATAAEIYAAENQVQYIAYYFYTTQRCPTCRKIEASSEESIKNSFSKELKNGTLVFQTLNIDEEQNKHFVKDFKLITKSLVIAKVRQNKTEQFRNLAKVWELVYSPEEFSNYVINEISSFMAGK